MWVKSCRLTVRKNKDSLDCKTVRIFAYSCTREQSNKRSGTRLKTESETWGETLKETRALCARKTLTARFTDFSTDFEKKKRLFCSLKILKFSFFVNGPIT